MKVNIKTGVLALDINVIGAAINQEVLIGFAARNNEKRGFLFLSKVLGKHYPSSPRDMKSIFELLACKISEVSPHADLFIGMAETATGLGHGIYEEFLQLTSKPALYVHTTRYSLDGYQQLRFEETHSHATDQILYVADHHNHQFAESKNLVLIDDEISTGNTFKNLVKAFNENNGQVESVTIVSLVSFVKKERLLELADVIGVPVYFVSLCDGEFEFTPNDYQYDPVKSAESKPFSRLNQLNIDMGRTGVNKALDLDLNIVSDLSKDWDKSEKILVLGTGEFMYSSYLVGLFLNKSFDSVFVQSTTRSPILMGNDVKSIIELTDNYGDGIPNYLYNVSRDDYDHILIIHETKKDSSLEFLANKLRAVTLKVEDNGKVFIS